MIRGVVDLITPTDELRIECTEAKVIEAGKPERKYENKNSTKVQHTEI